MRARHVRLRGVEPSDLPVFFEHQMGPVAHRMAAFEPRERPEFEAHWTRILIDETVIARTIVAAGETVGYIVCFEREGVHEVGYWIGREHWGRGIASGALARFLTVVQARPLYARVAQHNVASARVLEKCGFTIVPAGFLPAIDEVEEIVLRLDADRGD
jgi:RimJ/RimL family protein N-acetyltransferase